MSTVTDYQGEPLTVGASVKAYYNGREYRAVVKEIKPAYHDTLYRHVIVTREDGTDHQTFSDSVIVLNV